MLYPAKGAILAPSSTWNGVKIVFFISYFDIFFNCGQIYKKISELCEKFAKTMRIDKYLWAVRLFKTRNEAADACKGGKVKVNDAGVKPSREVKPGDTVTVRRMPVTYTYKVVAVIEKRQPAKNVPLFLENSTPPEELAKLTDVQFTSSIRREPGAGRPTKKERRALDSIIPKFQDLNI
jgi:ribosome-associated heat shock protein Hsp15